MRKTFFKTSVLFALMLGGVLVAHAQMRDQEMKPSEYSGPIIKKEGPSNGANLSNLFNMKMSQSFSMNFGSFGGQVMNVDAFTNSMQFFFNKNLTGQVDVSLLDSPFGQNNFYGFNDKNKLQVALDAQLNYQINDHMDLHFELNHSPGGYGYYPGYGNYYTNPFHE